MSCALRVLTDHGHRDRLVASVNNPNQIRAEHDARTIVVYQAYGPAIATPAVAAKKFVPPFSTARMTWIKPSFLWLMERSNWAQKPGQERVLAVRITRAGWDEALAAGVLTVYTKGAHRDIEDWQQQFAAAAVHVQWDPERTVRGARRELNAIQVGLSRRVIERYVDEWIVDIVDFTPQVRKIHTLVSAGKLDRAGDLLPRERLYPLAPAVARRLAADPGQR